MLKQALFIIRPLNILILCLTQFSLWFKLGVNSGFESADYLRFSILCLSAALIAAGMAALFAVVSLAPAPLPQHFLVLMLSVVIGFYVIGKVHHALHTPLMSVTNAISGIVVVAAILQINDTNLVVQILAAFGVLLASINVFGGFAVTSRMLKMFTRGDK
jgi:NAD/NADP transhydrogenase alpha subunit